MEHECYVCKRPNADLHHIFGGRNRQTSDRLGLTVYLCREHHREVHDHTNHGLDMIIKRQGQREFEKTHTRQEFINTFGKSYILEDEYE